jgi:hypothetical protein
MNVQQHYQLLLRHGMGQLTSIMQGHFRNADRQVTQIQQLQTLLTEKEGITLQVRKLFIIGKTRSMRVMR